MEEIYTSLPNGEWYRTVRLRRCGDTFNIPAERIHRIIELPEGECITAVIQTGDPQPWRHFDFDPAKEVLEPLPF